MQLEHGLKRKEPTYLAAVLEVKPDHKLEISDEVAEVLKEFSNVMPLELPKHLPPLRAIDHPIELIPSGKPPAKVSYHMTPLELQELRKLLTKLLYASFIQSLKAPFGALVIFHKKQDNSMQLYVDYRGLNKVTVKNYPMSLIQDLFNRFTKAIYFTKLDLRSGYWHVRISEGDELKTTCVTCYGAFEFLVMPIGHTNAPPTFVVS